MVCRKSGHSGNANKEISLSNHFNPLKDATIDKSFKDQIAKTFLSRTGK